VPLGSVHFLHGFLGQSTDWDGLIPPGIPSLCYDFFTPEAEQDAIPLGLESLAGWINQKARSAPGPRILLGYSLGGRVALHALLQAPEVWEGAVLVSAHPGLRSPDDRDLRLKSDQAWARKFETESWDPLIHEWNAQAVFKGGRHPLLRPEADFSRKNLARSLEQSSLGRQEDLRERLKGLQLPVLWVCGELDVKFRGLAEGMAALNPRFCVETVLGAGHRVPWDQPQVFKGLLDRALF